MYFSKLYTRTGAFQGVLQNAKVGYTLRDAPLSTATLVLPADDPQNALLTPYAQVEVMDGGRRIDLFRVIAMPGCTLRAQGGSATHRLEHVLATLLDDILPGYHEIGGTGFCMADCIRYVLSWQTTKRWRLGRCDFDTQFQYSFSNDYLLKALLALPRQLAEPYLWTTDTTSFPWTLNLVRPGAGVECELRYRQNMREIQKSYDASDHCTRVYPYGYGEGINQLTIRDVNGGVPYIDADTASTWGLIVKPFVDSTMEQPQALYQRAKAWLEQQKNPRFSYRVKAVDLYRLTGEDWYRFHPGRLCRVNDQEHGVLVEARVTQVSKADVNGGPEDVTITLANAPGNVANELADLAARASVNELYAQGATNLYAEHFADNATPQKPCRFRFPVDRDCVRINRVILKFDLEAFRAYSQGVEAGGGRTQTSGSGGGGTRTSASGGEATLQTPVKAVVGVAQCHGPIDANGDSSAYTSKNTEGLASSAKDAVDTYGSGTLRTGSAGGGSTGAGSGHYHTITSHRHSIADGGEYTGYHQPGCTTEGSHTHSGPSHTHQLDSIQLTVPSHSHGLPAHRHWFDHSHAVDVSVTVPAMSLALGGHSHSVTFEPHSHEVSIPAHTHEPVYGIFEGGTARTVSLRVDGADVPADAVQGGQVDLVPYLSKDDKGKIRRGVWHSVELRPDAATRVVADLYVKTFIRSQGGGDY